MWYLKVYRRRDEVVRDYFSLLREAGEAREAEEKAAIKLQSFLRCCMQRLQYAALKRSALLIARVYRGHLARSEAAALKAKMQEARRLATISCAAVVIQRHFRGFLSRRHVFDLSARARLLQSNCLLPAAAAASAVAADTSTGLLLCPVLLLLLQMQEAESLAVRFAAAAQSRQYLRSTQAIPGVFLPAKKTAAAAMYARRRETRLQQVMSAAAAAAKQQAEQRHLEAEKLLGVDIDRLLKDPQNTVSLLQPRAAAAGPAATANELRAATQLLLRGCCSSPPVAAAAAATAGREAAGGAEERSG
ncbi:hypothetical protein Efla_004940 [Eimeria flavescens]